MLSRVGSGPVGVCVIGLQLDFPLHSSLIPDGLVGSRPPCDSTVELGWVMCHGLYTIKRLLKQRNFFFSLLFKQTKNKQSLANIQCLEACSILKKYL